MGESTIVETVGLGGFAPLPLRLGGTPTDGITAEQWSRLAADLSAVVRTAPFAIITIQQTGDAVAVLVAYQAQHGVGVSHAPTIVANGAGRLTITWAPAYTDPFGNAQAVNIKHADAMALSAGAALMATVDLTGRADVDVRTFDTTGAETSTTVTVAVY